MSMSEIKDLRRTNFVVGGDDNKDDLSVYYRDYRPWELPSLDKKAQTYKFQKTNFHLGEQEGGNQWGSTNNKDFVKHEGQVPSRLNEETKRDLRNHHFDFGRQRLIQAIGKDRR